MLFLDENLPVVRKWRLYLLRATAIFCNYSAAVLEAIVVVSQCNEILLKIALAFTNSFAFYLSTMLRLNAFLRLMLAGVLPSREEMDQHGQLNCSTWPSSRTFRYSSCSPLCCAEGTSGKSVQSLLHAVLALCRRSPSICMTVIRLAPSAVPPPRSNITSTVSTIVTLCRCIRPVLSTLQTLTVNSTQVLGIVWDLSSLLNSP